MAYIMFFVIGVGLCFVTCLTGLFMFRLSGVLAGLSAPVADLLVWLSVLVPGSPTLAALVCTTLLFLLFRVLFLPYWSFHARVHRATGKVSPDFAFRSRNALGPTDPYPTGRAWVRLVFSLFAVSVFYFVVLRACQGGLNSWPPSQTILTRAFQRISKSPASEPFAILRGLLLVWLGAMVLVPLMVYLSLASAALLSSVLPHVERSAAREFGEGESRALRSVHLSTEAVFPVFLAESVALVGLVSATHLGRGHPFTDYVVKGYVLGALLYAPIWSAASVFMDWRNEQWVASLTRELEAPTSEKARRAAEEKLAELARTICPK